MFVYVPGAVTICLLSFGALCLAAPAAACVGVCRGLRQLSRTNVIIIILILLAGPLTRGGLLLFGSAAATASCPRKINK